MQPTYHLLTPRSSQRGVDLFIAGDGVYTTSSIFGLTLPVSLLACEIRGLVPLTSWAFFGGGEQERDDNPVLPIGYHVLTQPTLPDFDPSHIFAYVIAQNGVFLQAQSAALDVLMPLASGSLPGLFPASPYARCRYPSVPKAVVCDMLLIAQAAHDEVDNPIECLFYLTWESDRWLSILPAQVQTSGSVRAIEETPAYQLAVFEGHSHHQMSAYFSRTDNLDEVINGGFRAYFVLGRVHSQPEIAMRICVHGYSWDVPASWFFDLPESVLDHGAAPNV